MELEKHVRGLYGCTRCGVCVHKYGPWGDKKVCPIREHTVGFEPYSARGRNQVAIGVLEGTIEVTPELAEVTRRIGVADPVILQSMYIFKPPHIGGEVVCHQDSTFIYTEPESCLGFWFALEDATVHNGCLYFIPGQHLAPLKQRNYRVDDRTLTTEVLDAEPWPEELKLPAEAKVGTLVIFHGRTPHLSGPNLSAKSRHAYTLHVIDKNCHYPAENWLQRNPDLPLRGFN